MAVHSLDGQGSIDVMSVKGKFATLLSKVIRADGDGSRRLQFGRPTGTAAGADISFRFKTKGLPKGFLFGIKQFVSVDWYNASYKGNKPIDGWIWESFKAQSRFMLDMSNVALDVMFHPVTNLPTGAQASASWAPFYAGDPEAVKDGTDIEQSIGDAPGGIFALELRNGATDRINYLESIRIKQTFLTVLIAITPNKSHVPLEAAYWQNVIEGNVKWDGKPDPDVSRITNSNRGIGTFKDIKPDFAICDFSLLTNKALGVRDSIVQQMNDAMFNVRGRYKAQDFKKPTRALTRIEARGYEIVQYPTAL
jgi:hypothetical protein